MFSVWRNRRILILFAIILVSSIYITKNIIYQTTSSGQTNASTEDDDTKTNNKYESHRLAILVPFRDRFDELITFVPLLSSFLHAQGIKDFQIYVINQSAKYRFNRGALINVGYLLSKNWSDYIAIHDVDLIPLNKNLTYTYPERGPYHLSAPNYHPQYNYEKYLGGILLIKNDHFELVNGMSNRYFGWGLEDDEFYTRIQSKNLQIFRPLNLSTSKNDTFLHFHYGRKRDMFKSKEQREALRRRDRVTGLNNIRYSVTDSHDLTIDKQYYCKVYSVEIYCDTKDTPWCLHNAPSSSTKKSRTGL